jgi:DNA-directed RNA polymerase beta' subunit
MAKETDSKRVNFSARSVITSDPNIGVDELGVPIRIAMNLTFPEIVTPDNYERLSKLVQNGRDTYPGANYIIRDSNGKQKQYNLKYIKKGFKLNMGDIVERHLQNGDIGLFNRQPTLHKISMMGHKLRIINDNRYNTFRLNVDCTAPYNADFDGDEMNLFIPQSIQTQIELEKIQNVKLNIISPKSSDAIIAPKQDSITGAYRASGSTHGLDWREMMNLAMYINEIDVSKLNIKKDTKYMGNEIFNLVIPNTFNMVVSDSSGNKIFDINNGKLNKGIFGKGSLKSTITMIWDRLGPDEAKNFINNTQRLGNYYLMNDGFTVGYGDGLINNDLKLKISTMIESKKLEVETLITQMENNPESMDVNLFENILKSSLDEPGTNIGQMVFDSLNNSNNYYVMVKSGAKGSNTNIGQIMAAKGQVSLQNVGRVPRKVNNRTLPHFTQFDDTADARGFISNSFTDGQTPIEFFFDVLTGREGLIDTAIKSVTADTPIIVMEDGNIQHILIGDWIDNKLNEKKDKVEKYEEREMELLRLDNKVCIPTADENGKVSWGEITAITRHDPGKELYEIKTHGGRQVIVTESKSLLIWNNNTNKFEMKSTPEVKVGDCVPVTMNLPTPPIIKKYIDMNKYLPKTQYIYGSDFKKANTEINKALKSDGKTPAGWWEKNNGSSFVLPYEHAHRLMRARVRSNMSNIKEGYIYPYSSNREHILIPDKFVLNNDNGRFIGLFLAEGNVDIDSGYVQITNNNQNIKRFVKNWFDNLGIKYTDNSKTNHIGGISSDIRGFSTILGKFLTKLVGHGAKNKYVLNEAFNAPEEFIIGLLDGYFSGDGTVTKNSLQVGSASFQLINGINMLLSRLGIFGKITITRMKKNNIGTQNMADINMLSIRGQWAKIFANKISLIDNDKNDKLKEIKPSDIHRNFQEHNDVVLDSIVEINKIDIAKYPKVYDLTVPSTLNFGLANGLHVVDTADSGYTQRKLIKALEDMMVNYDFSVRSSNNIVLQYVYGDSGVNTAKQRKQKLNFITYNNQTLKEKLCFTKEQLQDVSKKTKQDMKALDKLNEDVYNYIKELRDELRNIQEKSNQSVLFITSDYFLPIDYTIILSNMKSLNKTPLTPQYVMERIHHILKPEVTQLMCMAKKTLNDDRSMKYQDQFKFKRMFEYSLFEYISPKKCIIDYGLDKEGFDNMVEDIIQSFNNSLVEPGDMIGCTAAQCLGEPLTQMSCIGPTFTSILVEDKNLEKTTLKHEKIGEIVDDIIRRYPKLVKPTGYHDSVEVEIPSHLDYYIPSVQRNGKVEWCRISHVSRHPANGELVRVKTYTGKEIITTPNHSHLAKTSKGIEPIPADKLALKHRIPVCRNLPIVSDNKTYEIELKDEDNFIIDLDDITGWLFGAYLAEGSLNGNSIRLTNISEYYTKNAIKVATKYNLPHRRTVYKGAFGNAADNFVLSKPIRIHIEEQYKKGSYNKIVPDYVFDSNDEFMAGLLRGYFDGDGNVNLDRNQVRCGSRSKKLMEGISELLLYFGITTTLYEETKKMAIKNDEGDFILDDKGNKIEEEKILYCLGVLQSDIPKFNKYIGSDFPEKKQALDNICKCLKTNMDDDSTNDKIDMIPCPVTEHLASCGRKIGMEGHSRTLGRYIRDGKDIGYRTLAKYIKRLEDICDEVAKTGTFQDVNKKKEPILRTPKDPNISEELKYLKEAFDSDVIWDPIVEIEYLPDPKEYVYDFTVPGNQTFMISNGIFTHNTLNTFHSSGSGSAGMQGVPRLKELISCTANIKTPITTIALNPDVRGNKILVDRIASYVRYLTIEDITTKTEIIFDPEPNGKSGYARLDNTDNVFFVDKSKAVQGQSGAEMVPWLLRIFLDKEKIIEKDVNMLYIKSRFVQFWNETYTDAKKVTKEEKEVLNSINHVGIATNDDNSPVPIVHIRFDLNTISMDMLNGLNNLVVNNFKLKGVNDIEDIDKIPEDTRVVFDADGNVNREKQFTIFMKGINMLDIRKIRGINLAYTVCNSVTETYEKFGIEATRALLVNHLSGVFVTGGHTVNYQHIAILADMMTNTGGLTSIDRHGINRLDTDPLSRVSFERQVDELLNAAVFAETDHMRSVSSRIMAGQCFKGGTGYCDVLLDNELLENTEYVDISEDRQKEFAKTTSKFKPNMLLNDMLNKKHLRSFIPV